MKTQYPIRALLLNYIGGGWGNDAVDEQCSEVAWVIRGTDIPSIRLGVIDGCPLRYHKLSNYKSRALEVGDIVFEVSGGSKDQPVGRCIILNERLLRKLGGKVIPASFCKRLIPNPAVVEPTYLFFVFDALYQSKEITQWQVQSTGISNFSFESFLDECLIPLPALPYQRRIASILSAYDELIENNIRRIATLEEMARRLYEEWFIHFRFPGHEQVQMVESDLGLIPEGWEAKPLGNFTDYINRGLSPRYDNNATGLVLNQKCIRNGCLSLEPARRQSKPVPKEKTVRFGDVLINSTGVGTLGRVAQVYEELSECTVDSHVTIVRPQANCDIDFFGLALLGMESHFEQQGVGATGQTELGRGRIAETQLVVPPEHEQKKFGQAVRPLRQLSVNLARKNANLRAQRDLLLPKLISGEIDVSAFPEAEAVAA